MNEHESMFEGTERYPGPRHPGQPKDVPEGWGYKDRTWDLVVEIAEIYQRIGATTLTANPSYDGNEITYKAPQHRPSKDDHPWACITSVMPWFTEDDSGLLFIAEHPCGLTFKWRVFLGSLHDYEGIDTDNMAWIREFARTCDAAVASPIESALESWVQITKDEFISVEIDRAAERMSNLHKLRKQLTRILL